MEPMTQTHIKCPECGAIGHVRNVGCCGVKYYMCFPCQYKGYPDKFQVVETVPGTSPPREVVKS